jgi:hypothetical protein
MLECDQEDPTNPQPCSPEDRAKYPGGEMPSAAGEDNADAGVDTDAGCNPDFGDCPPPKKK